MFVFVFYFLKKIHYVFLQYLSCKKGKVPPKCNSTFLIKEIGTFKKDLLILPDQTT